MRPQYTTDYFDDISTLGSVHGYSEARSRSNSKGAHTHTENNEQCGKAHFFCVQIFSGNMSMQLIGVPLTHIQQLKLFPLFSDVRMIKIV